MKGIDKNERIERIVKKVYDRKHETTSDLLESSHDLLRAAELVETRQDHVTVWNVKVHILRMVNDAFETGYFTDISYDELRNAKWLLSEVELKAGYQAMRTYASQK